MFRKYFLAALFIMFNLVLITVAYAQDNVPEDETVIFRSADPDVLILLDLSLSMSWNVAGENTGFFYAPINTWGKDTTCKTPLSNTKTGTYPVSCSRLDIAKRALFTLLDANGSLTITSDDSDKMSVRFGLMTFHDSTVTTVKPISNIVNGVALLKGTSYQSTFCGSATSCAAPSVGGTTTTGSYILGAQVGTLTNLVDALNSAKTYLDTHKAADSYKNCRQKFVLLISDGSDTKFCGANTECDTGSYRRRRATVDAVKKLKDAGYKVFVVGFGAAMPDYLEKTLNWMAYFGGTDNPKTSNVLPTTLYDPTMYPNQTTICSRSADTGLLSGTCDGATTSGWFAPTNDPGYIPLSGYAFLADSPAGLSTALRLAINDIKQANYTFTQAAIQAVRTVDENFLYEASFQPINNEPLWHGHLKRFNIDNSGNIATSTLWDGGAQLTSMNAGDRHIYTYTGGALTVFNTTNISAPILDLTVGTATVIEAQRQLTIGFTCGGDPGAVGYESRIWKLGDIFHSSPVSVGTPSPYYFDVTDKPDSNGKKAFDLFRDDHPRTTVNTYRRIYAGANDGQLHAFIAAELSNNGGKESWSFIPPNLLSSLSLIAHNNDPDSVLNHQFYVDGSISISDVYLDKYDLKYTNTSAKDKTKWKTLLFFGEGRGAYSSLWSSSTSCDSGFSDTYSSDTYKYYCGYYALDITNTTTNTPVFKWLLGNTTLTSAQASYLGYPLNKITMGRVRLNDEERWVGFIGGGYSGQACSASACADTKGKGFYVVDLIDGSILWSYTRGNDSTMNYDLVGQSVAVDIDRDGFVDTVYSGDLGGNMWRFKFCLNGASCADTTAWSGGKFYNAEGVVNPIYTISAVTLDYNSERWVYFGTGDKIDPITAAAQPDRLYAIRDTSQSGTYTLSNLKNISLSSATYDITTTDDKSKQGWYIKFATAEKMLADPIVFSGVVYYTTYVPPTGSSDPCSPGTAYLNAVNFQTGAGGYFSGSPANPRQVVLGSGIVSSVLVSRNPVNENWDIYAPPGDASSTQRLTDKFKDGVLPGGSGTQYLDVTTDGTNYVKKIAPQNKQLYWLYKR